MRVREVAPAPTLARKRQPSASVVPGWSTIQPVSAALRVRVSMRNVVMGRVEDSAGLVHCTRTELWVS